VTPGHVAWTDTVTYTETDSPGAALDRQQSLVYDCLVSVSFVRLCNNTRPAAFTMTDFMFLYFVRDHV